MKISLEQAGKRYGHYWIFRHLNLILETPGRYALLGNNGSGKSTLLRTMAGMQNLSSGKIFFEQDEEPVPVNGLFPLLSFCAPGMELPEELTLRELLEFHFSFKKIISGMSVPDIISMTGLEAAANKPLTEYSSGMKQRVKLAQAIFSDTPLLLLDEPCTNLDEDGVQQYLAWITNYTARRLVVIASNDAREYSFCGEKIWLSAFK